MTSRNSKGQFRKVIKPISAANMTEDAVSFRDLVALEAFKIYMKEDSGYPTHCAQSAYMAADIFINSK